MAACFQVILTWSSLTTAKLFPLFFSLSLSLFFVQGCSKTASERKQKRWPEVMARLDQRAGKFSNLGSTGYGKLCCEKGEGRREGEGGGVARVHPGGYIFIFRLCDVSGVGRNQKFRDTRCGRSHVSFVALRSFVVQRRIAFVEGEQVFTGESSSCFDTLRLTTVSERILSEIVYENYSWTITILRLLFSPSFFHTK